MTELARIAGLGIVVSIVLSFLRKEMASLGAQVSIAFVVVVLMYVMKPLGETFQTLLDVARQAKVRSVYVDLILKAIGIAYVASIGADLSRDAGETAVASVIELAGKIFILVLAVPVMMAILEALVTLLPG